jgi:hypothetical protein
MFIVERKDGKEEKEENRKQDVYQGKRGQKEMKEVKNNRKPKWLTLECLTVHNASLFLFPLGIIITKLASLYSQNYLCYLQ